MDCGVDVSSQGVSIVYDAVKKQQLLCLNLAVQMSIPQLLQGLLSFQQSDGRPSMAQCDAEATSTASQTQGLASEAEAQAAAQIPLAPSVAPAACMSVMVGADSQPRRPLPPATSPATVAVPTHDLMSALAMVGSEPGNSASALGPAPRHSDSPAFQEPEMEVARPALLMPPTAADPTRSSSSHASAVAPIQLETSAATSADLLQVVMAGDVAEVRAALQRKDTARALDGSLLHAALESGGRVDVVNLLIQAKCDVDSPGADRKTPLHLAITQHSVLSPMLARLLLSAQANLNAPDAMNVTPLDCAKMVAKQAANNSNAIVRQLLDEVSERPTLAVCVIESEQVLGACFADAGNDKVVFHTDTAIGLYSLTQRRIFLKQKLTQLRVQSVVRSVAVNPETGTVAVFLEVTGMGQVDNHMVQNLITVWPTGQVQDEEPLKLIVESEPGAEVSYPPAIMSSTSKDPLTLLCRIFTGKVLCWRLNSACSQLVSESKLISSGGPMAISANGRWAVVSDRGAEGSKHIEIWSFENSGGRPPRTHPVRVATLERRPQSVAVIERGAGMDSCFIALAEEVVAGGPPTPIEVMTVQVDGSVGSAYRMHPESPCSMLSFCHDSEGFLMSGHTDGLVIVYNLQQGQLRLSHDDENIRSASISMDRTLIVSTVGSILRIYKVSDPGAMMA